MSLFHYCRKVFPRMNTWMVEKNSMKHHYQRKIHLNMEDITDAVISQNIFLERYRLDSTYFFHRQA